MRIIPKTESPGTSPGTAAPAPGSLTLSNGLSLPVIEEALHPLLVPRAGRDGVHLGLTYGDYSDDPALRHSIFNRIAVSPLYLKTSVEEPDEDSAAMTWGRVFHTLVLQPELEAATVVVVDASTRSTNLYKTAAALNPGKDLVLRHEYDDIRRARDRFNGNYLNQELLRDTQKEVSVFWDNRDTGIPCKARPDAMGERRIIDIKTSRDLKWFKKDAVDYGYFRQAAWYQAGVEAATGRGFSGFFFIAVEKRSPFDSIAFSVPWSPIADAMQENRNNLRLFKHCVDTNTWPGYPEKFVELKP